MINRILMSLCSLLVVAGLFSCSGDSNHHKEAYTGLELKAQKTRATLMNDGATWLASRQKESGMWGNFQEDLGLTALAMRALYRIDKVKYKAQLDKGLKTVLATQVKEEGKNKGAFSDKDGKYLNYKTSLCIMLLHEIDPKKYENEIDLGQRYVMGLQFKNEKEKNNYGAIGYGSNHNIGDLSNTQYAVEALVETGVDPDSEVFQKVKMFLREAQNPDGGAAYGPGENGAGKSVKIGVGDDSYYKSYGSMTYALLKSMIYCQLDKKDPPVQAAFNWVTNNYSLDENPGLKTVDEPALGLQGLFYYYHTFAKALKLYGQDEIPLPNGEKANWREDLIEKLSSMQREGKYWSNTQDRWWEKSAILCTSYVLLALDETK